MESTSAAAGNRSESVFHEVCELAIKVLSSIGLVAFIVLFVTGCAPRPSGQSATIAVAANFKNTLERLETGFEENTMYTIDIVSGSTGKLYAQIINGAPYDVFLAADQSRPRMLVEGGYAAAANQPTYALGKLALWSPVDPNVTPDTLIAPGITRLAVSNPDLAPYGLAALQVLDRLDLKAQLRPKFVFGENVGQTLAFVSTGNAQIGFVSAAQILVLPEDMEGSAWLVPPQLHDPIAQDAVLLTTGRDNAAAVAFMSYLQSAEARDIIARSGYALP